MSVFQPTSRRQTFIGSPPLLNFAPDIFIDPVVIQFDGPRVEINEGAWLQPIVVQFDAPRVLFDNRPGQGPWLVQFDAPRVEINNSEPLPWLIQFDAPRVELPADFVKPIDTTPWLVQFDGPRVVMPWAITLQFDGPRVEINNATATATRRTYCYNLRSEGGPQATELTNFEFIRILPIQGHLIGLKADGLYELGGTTDNGTAIESSFTLAPFMGAPDKAGRAWMSRCRWVHAAISTEAEIIALTDEDGSETYAESPAYAFGKGRANARRAQMGGGLRSGLWGFHIASTNGERMKAAWLEFDFEQLSRRI